MLGKLLKYEVKATSKTFIPIYISIILISLINVTFMRNNIIFYANLSLENLKFIDAFKKVLTIGILQNIILVCILFVLSNYLLSKKLNLN